MLGVVGQRKRLILVFEGRDRSDRAEDLLGEQFGLGGNRGEHGRLEEIAGAIGTLPADDELGARRDGVGHERLDLRALSAVDQRADVDTAVGSPAERQPAHLLGELGRELFGE